jgi:hypothetical protein
MSASVRRSDWRDAARGLSGCLREIGGEKDVKLLLVGAAWLAVPAAAEPPSGPEATAEPPIVPEARAFMDAYGRDLARGDREAIVRRYDGRGAWHLGRGAKQYATIPQIRAIYTDEAWTPPAAFAWRNLSYEALGPDAVVVAGQFEWTSAGRMVTYSYTGLLVREDGQLRIRLEDEDPEPGR